MAIELKSTFIYSCKLNIERIIFSLNQIYPNKYAQYVMKRLTS